MPQRCPQGGVYWNSAASSLFNYLLIAVWFNGLFYKFDCNPVCILLPLNSNGFLLAFQDSVEIFISCRKK